MRDVYACSFELDVDSSESSQALDEAARAALEWAREHYNDAPEIEDPGKGSWHREVDYVEWTTLEVAENADRLWTLTLFHRDRSDDTLGWRSTVQLASDDGGMRFGLRLAIEPISKRIAPAQFEVGRPRVVRTMAEKFSGVLDGRPLVSREWLVGAADIDQLVDLLLSPNRLHPVVVTTLSPETGRPTIDDSGVARRLLGVAHVARLRSGEAAWELTRRLGKTLSVFNGAVRIYWPGFAIESRPFDHRLWIPDRIASMAGSGLALEDRLMRLISSVAVLRTPADPLARRLRRMIDERQLSEIVELRARVKQARDEVPGDFLDEFEATLQREEAAQTRIIELQEELGDVQQGFAELSRLYAAGGVEPELDADDELVATVPEAVDRAAAAYPDELVFLPEALESASESTYPNPERVHQALSAMGDIVRSWRDGALAAGFGLALRDLGFTFGADVSEVAVGKHPGEYQRRYNGREITLGPHIKLGRRTSAGMIARIYWWVDEDARRFVVGHVGRHLEDDTT